MASKDSAEWPVPYESEDKAYVPPRVAIEAITPILCDNCDNVADMRFIHTRSIPNQFGRVRTSRSVHTAFCARCAASFADTLASEARRISRR